MLNIIGTGLSSFEDITLRGKRLIENSDEIYLEIYTSKLAYDSIDELKKDFQKKFKKDLIIAYRKDIENDEDLIIEKAKTKDISILVIGDALSATTHTELILNAKKHNIKTNVVHNASVFNAVAATGLQLYKFGKTASLVFDDTVKSKDGKPYLPESPYKILRDNLSIKAHTLFLLDIKIDEKSERFMTVNDAIAVLEQLDREYEKNYDNKSLFTEKTKLVGIARLGSDDENIVYAEIKNLRKINFGQPVHCLIYPSDLHFAEEDLLEQYAFEKGNKKK